MTERVYHDFMAVDDWGRLILAGAPLDAIRRLGIELRDGTQLTIYGDDLDRVGNGDDLVAVGTLRYDDVAQRWVAEIDWDLISHESES